MLHIIYFMDKIFIVESSTAHALQFSSIFIVIEKSDIIKAVSLSYASIRSVLTHWGRDKMAAISQTIFFKFIFLNGNVWISIKISRKFVPKGPINNIPALVQIMTWRLTGDKPLSEPMMA